MYTVQLTFQYSTINCSFTSNTVFYVLLLYQEHVLTITNQQQDLESKSHTIAQLLKDKSTIESKLNVLSLSLQALEKEILDLRGEKAVMQEQLISDGDSAKVLDEYKKRAQLALKKVKTLKKKQCSLLFAIFRTVLFIIFS